MAVNYVEVKVEEGILRGQERTSDGFSQIKYYSFLGIPYAKPPIGDLRFQAPQPAESWDGVRDALADGKHSAQISFLTNEVAGDEDCLYLNVFTPELPSENKKLNAVIINVHGGGFFAGTGGSDFFTPDYFLEHDVVYVSLHYRTGALGFLSLQNDEISGNAGLKDQVEALKWTRNNIKQFGGDPDNITIMGCSAGGASIEYLVLTDLTKGLFKQAVIQSGSAFNPWAFNVNPREYAVTFAHQLGYSGSIHDDKALLEFFKSCSTKEIVEKQMSLTNEQESALLMKFSFAPCVEKEGKGQKFITRTPREIYESSNFNKVPVIVGLCNCEGNILLMCNKSLEPVFENSNKALDYFIPLNLNVPNDKRDEVGREIKEFYFGGQPLSKDNLDSLIDLVGDLAFNYGICKGQNYLAQHSHAPIYCYGVSYRSSSDLLKKFISQTHQDVEIKGVGHAGDMVLLYKFKIPNMGPAELSENDKKCTKRLTSMYAEFAKTGNPNYEGMDFPKWEPTEPSEIKYLDIGNEMKMIPGRLHEERLQFWDKLYREYGYLF